MRKKGLVINQMVKFIIGLAFLVLLSSIFFIGPNALYTDLKKIIPRADIDIERDYFETADFKNRPEQDQALLIFEELYSVYGELAKVEDDVCFGYVDNVGLQLDLFETEYIVRVGVTNDGSFLELAAKIETANQAATEVWSPLFNVPVDNVKPCLVLGDTESTNFFEAWLSEEPSSTGNLDQYKVVDGFELSKNKITLSGSTAQKEYGWETQEGGKYVLFKHEENICFFPTNGDFDWDFIAGRCDGDTDVLDASCFYGGETSARLTIYDKIEDNNHPLLGEDCVIGGDSS